LKRDMLSIAGAEIELFDSGAGEPLLLLHSGQGFGPDHPYVALLAKKRRVIAPSHPGFGQSSLPDWLDSVEDIAHIYLELMDRLGLDRVDMIGNSIGGWIAADMATKSPERIKRLVLVSPVGIKIGSPDKLDIPDIFALPQEKVNRLLFHDPDKMRFDPSKLSDQELGVVVRNRETLAMLTWEPYMHSPKLKHRLHRLTMPVLFLRGESDGLISPDYLAGYAKLVPNARIETIAAAGHASQMEQPETFAAKALAFLEA
jgi:pimeloyl-ACP methyl ester carboxylesterase